MPITITDEIIQHTALSEEEFRVELAFLLYQAQLLNFGKARELSGLDMLSFLEVMGKRKIEAPYSEENFESDLHLSRQIRLPA